MSGRASEARHESHFLADRRERVETPEHVAIGYELADLGSRFAALLVDTAIVIATLLTLVLVPLLLVRPLSAVPRVVAGWGLAVLVITAFIVIWGYFVYFEGLRDGQTPGKRWLRIRVVHDGGYPLTLRGAAVRNLLRILDFQPAPSWLVGGVTMLLTSRTKRLGDLAAGTIVVRERAAPKLPEELELGDAQGPPLLEPEELATLRQYIARRESLSNDVRQRLALQLLTRLEPRVAADERRKFRSPDRYLELLYGEEAPRHAASAASEGPGSRQAMALVQRQRRDWDEYLELLERAQRRGLGNLTEAEVSRFASLYREIAADLARVRTYGGSPTLLYSLERWVGGGHNLLYRPAQRSWRLLRAWFTAGFPRLVRKRWKPVLLGAALLYIPAIISFSSVRAEPRRVRALVPAEYIAHAERWRERDRVGESYGETPEVFMPAMSSMLVANNVQVTFLAFAGGLLAGLGAAYILLFNGMFLGAVAALYTNLGGGHYLGAFVFPHGIIELTAICIAGGAGLWMGSGLLLPGRRTRREMLETRGREGVSLIAGVAMMLVVAGLIEGFISPSDLPPEIKVLFGLATALLLVLYFGFAGKERG